MDKYTLLRDNKQAGTFSFEELRAKGLKALDLIWVEGKSASWKYPSEIPGLAELVTDTETTRMVVEPVHSNDLLDQDTFSQNAAGDSSALSLGGTSGETRKPKSPAVIRVIQLRNDEKETGTVAGDKDIAVNVRGELEKWNEPMTEMHAVPPVPLKKKSNLLETILIVVGAASLLGIGYLFGTSKTDPSPAPVENRQVAKDDQAELYKLLAPERETIDEPVNKPETSAPVVQKKPTRKKAAPVDNSPVVQASQASGEQPASKGNEVVSEQKEKRSVNKDVLYSLIKVSANNYKRKFLGGISDLRITIDNNSPFQLDEISVDISYIKNNEQVAKTETLHFRNIRPGGSYSLDAVGANKGVKVQYRIAGVKSTEAGL